MLVLDEKDATWFFSTGFMWSVIEVSTAILCTCLPTMRVIFNSVLAGRLGRALGLNSQEAPAGGAPYDGTRRRRPGWPRRLGADADANSMGEERRLTPGLRALEGADVELAVANGKPRR